MASAHTVPDFVPARRPSGAWLALAGLVFLAVAPTLGWLEFANTPENLVVETALEIRRGGAGADWLVPTLDGSPRTKKPPLAAWVTAAALRRTTLDAIASTDPAARAAGYRALARDVRWPALLASCLTLLCAAELGLTLGGPRHGRALGTLALLAGASTFLFLRFGRLATADTYLTLFVALANVALAKAVFDRRRWAGCCGAGLALGLAFMTKGPVGFAQTLAPLAVFLAWRKVRGAGPDAPGPRGFAAWLLPALAAALLFAAVVLPWYLAMLLKIPGQWEVWRRELSRDDNLNRRDPVYAYLPLLAALSLPWLLFALAGAASAARAALTRRLPAPVGAGGDGHRGPLVYALFLVGVPVLVMTCFKDKQDRYLQPLAAAGAVLAAYGLRETVQRSRPATPTPAVPGKSRRLGSALVAGHWLGLALVSLGVPLAGFVSRAVRTVEGRPWYPAPLALAAAGGFLTLILAGAFLQRRVPAPAVALTTFVVMALAQALFIYGYGSARGGRSEQRALAEEIRTAFPDVLTYSAHPDPGKRLAVDLSIYLDRPTRWIAAADVPTLSPAARPRLVVYVQKPGRNESPPRPPPGWELFKQIPRGEDRWDLFVQRRR